MDQNSTISPHPTSPTLFDEIHYVHSYSPRIHTRPKIKLSFQTPKYLVTEQLRKTVIDRFRKIQPGVYISFSRPLIWRNEPYYLNIESRFGQEKPIILNQADIKRLLIDNPIFKVSPTTNTKNSYPVNLDPNKFANHPNLEILAPSLAPTDYSQTKDPKGYFFYQNDSYEYNPYRATLDYVHQFSFILDQKLRSSQAHIAQNLNPGDHISVRTAINAFNMAGCDHSLMSKNGKLFRSFDIGELYKLLAIDPIFSATLC